MTEIMFEVGGEGGSLTIERRKDSDGEKFIYHHNEMDMTDEGLGIDRKGEFDNFEQPFQLINSRYPWCELHLSEVHEDYRDYVVAELIKVLNTKEINQDDLYHSREQLEKVLKIKLIFGNQPFKSMFQHITIEFYNSTTTDYEYTNYADHYYTDGIRNDDLKVSKKIENLNWKTIKCLGTLHFSGSTVIIKNEFNQPTHVFNSEKALVTATPILSPSKSWFYKSV